MRTKRSQYFESQRRNAADLRQCDYPGCTANAEYRAPKSRESLNEHYWFCIDHIREYNSAWNYYEGLSEVEVEESIRNDVAWGRPTWRLGGRAQEAKVRTAFDAFAEAFGLFEEGDDPRAQADAPPPAERAAIDRALRMLDLRWPTSMDAVRTRYKQLVKQLHPDANGGDPEAEERLKRINQAYSVLKTSALARPRSDEKAAAGAA